jgi:hypothetical protein
MVTAAQSRTLEQHLAAEDAHDATAAAATYVEGSSYENAALGITFEGRAMVELQYAASYQLIDGMTAEYLWQHDGDGYVVQVGRIRGRVAPGDMLGVPASGGDVDFPFTAVITFDGDWMRGEHVFYELDLFCRQAGIDVAALRDAAAATGG